MSISDISDSRSDQLANIKEKLISGEYKFTVKRGRSKVWEIFSKFCDANGDEIAGMIACKTCYSSYRFAGSTSNLVKHKCYVLHNSSRNIEYIEVNTETKKQCVQVVSEWVVKNCRSFKIVEDSGLKKFARFLLNVGAKFGPNIDVNNLLPHPTTLSRNIKDLYEVHFVNIRSELSNYKRFGYSITSDIWTDNYLRASYVSCTIQYIKDGILFSRLLSVKSMEGASCTGENLFSFYTLHHIVLHV